MQEHFAKPIIHRFTMGDSDKYVEARAIFTNSLRYGHPIKQHGSSPAAVATSIRKATGTPL